MEMINHQIRLIERPIGIPKPTDWQYTKQAIPELKTGELLVKILYLSLDPAMRGWMNANESYLPPVNIGDVMRALGLGQVIASKHDHFAVGDYVTGTFGVQEYATSQGEGIHKIDAGLAPLPTYLSALGMTGLTAYFGLLDIGKPKSGETVVVSGAAGAVGMLVGQIAKLKGCRVIGIAGGVDKCNFIRQELHFDEAIDYKNENVKDRLRAYCSNGIDVYFDNVGGQILDDALSLLALHARVVLCGAISQYNTTTAIKGPGNYLALLIKRARMEGFIVFDYAAQYNKAIKEMAEWISTGTIKSQEDIIKGKLELFPDTFLKLFKGENLGKLILELDT